jgi:hypothetical protein
MLRYSFQIAGIIRVVPQLASAHTSSSFVGIGLVRILKFVIGERKDHEFHPGSQIRVQGERASTPRLQNNYSVLIVLLSILKVHL